MNSNTVAVVFNSHAQANAAADELRQAGVRDDAISVVARREGVTTNTDGAGDDTGEHMADIAKGAVGGAALGTILGIAALAIPGVGPFIGAGAIAASAVPAAAAAGAGIGAAGGSIVGFLTSHGVDEHDAEYFESHINNGGVFVSVDGTAAGLSSAAVLDILERNGGHRAERGATGRADMSTSPRI